MKQPIYTHPVFLVGAIAFAIVPVAWALAMGEITMADYYSFVGSLLGAGAGVGAAFLAVHLAQHSADQRDLKTLRDLLTEFASLAADMHELALTNPARGKSAALVHYRATRDAAIGMRTRGANAAKVAALLETDDLGNQLHRLHGDPNAQSADVQGRAGEMRELGQQLLAVLTPGL